ncbi:MAG: hypothetical protein DRN61_03510 [Thaumarchaeota archaeon]|nr:MAG: hypothetical protein DRN61_03510 [Nitrososphaerota archaeon]
MFDGDIYMDRCHIRRKEIERHLGDFMTSRWEILVFHKECFERVVMMLESDEDFPFIISTISKFKLFLPIRFSLN